MVSLKVTLPTGAAAAGGVVVVVLLLNHDLYTSAGRIFFGRFPTRLY